MNRYRSVVPAVAFLFTNAWLGGQTVKQGDPTARAADPTVFTSPMVIETVFAPADRSLWKSDEWTPQDPKPWKRGPFTIPEYHDLGKYSCDGLFFRSAAEGRSWESGLVMKVNPVAGGNLRVDIDAFVFNPGHVHDKMVTLFLEVMNGNEVAATTTITIKAAKSWRGKPEEHDGEGRLVLAAGALRTKPMTMLRITMTAVDY